MDRNQKLNLINKRSSEPLWQVEACGQMQNSDLFAPRSLGIAASIKYSKYVMITSQVEVHSLTFHFYIVAFVVFEISLRHRQFDLTSTPTASDQNVSFDCAITELYCAHSHTTQAAARFRQSMNREVSCYSSVWMDSFKIKIILTFKINFILLT